MRLNRPAVAAVAVFLPSLGGCTPGGEKGPETPATFVVGGGLPAARLAPVLVVKARSLVVPVALTNPTKDDFTYAVDRDGTELYQLGCILYRDGREVNDWRIHELRPRFQMHQVRRLKSGAAVALQYTLPYVKVKPGRYELRLIYEIYPESIDVTKHGLTAMKLEQTILLEVKDE